MERARKLASRAILRRLIHHSRSSPAPAAPRPFSTLSPSVSPLSPAPNAFRHSQSRSISVAALRPSDTFPRRHNSATPDDQSTMAAACGHTSLESLIDATVPKSIRAPSFTLPKFDAGLTESQMLAHMARLASKNRLFKSFIGMGYYNTFVPAVILRNIMENPGWYTQYTPYQAEIAQGRLESLLNFQTMITDLTALPMSNASLLDEGTAAAEAMAMCNNIHRGRRKTFLVASNCHPQTLDVCRTRADGFDLKVVSADVSAFDYSSGDVCGVLVQYPGTEGEVLDYAAFIKDAHAHGVKVVMATDLLALTVLKPPGELGADIVVGSAQRFGVPMGYGGPHAAFLATSQEYKRMMPGRIIGLSVDSTGKPALRMAMQTREQHIRRDKATSNICTAQALLANMAAMYAVYHGPEGLKAIAQRVHGLAGTFALGVKKLGTATVQDLPFFDTVKVTCDNAQAIADAAKDKEMNLRVVNANTITLSFDETTTLEDVDKLFEVFSGGKPVSFTAESLAPEVQPVIPSSVARESSYLTHPIFNAYHTEHELLRYLHRLQAKDLSLCHSMIPLGSCTMKLNATVEMMPVTWPNFADLHPFAPTEQAQGYQEMFEDLGDLLCTITGFDSFSLQPNAGAAGEYAGLMVIRAYHIARGDTHRNVCIIPVSAHGTNPASAAMCGMKIVAVGTDSQGNINIEELRKAAETNKDHLAALMVTYPSTHGVYEEGIDEICITRPNQDPAKMKSSPGSSLWILLAVLVLTRSAVDVDAFYLPGSYPHKYLVGDPLSVKVNSLTSIDTEMPFSYYSLPFCQPPEGIKDSAENLGELLMGDRIENSPYRFKMFTNESDILLCRTNPLSPKDFKLLKERIDEMYQVNLILDNLPAIRYTKKEDYFLRWTGYPVGIRVGDVYYVFNHLKFTVLVHKYEETNVARVMGTGDAADVIPTLDKDGSGPPGYMVVGFEVVPCSFQHDTESIKNLKMYEKYPAKIQCDPTTVAMAAKENQPLVFTYEVSFVESDIKWPSRWDAYLKMEGAKVHWFSILNSLMVIAFLAGIVLVIFLRTVRRDLTRYEELDKEAQAQMNEELSGWKLVVADVFRVPRNPTLLCVLVGDGVQILGMAAVTVLFAALGFMSPASRGMLVTGMLLFYMVLGIAAGYVAVRLWKTMKCGDHSGWRSVSWRVACFFPGVAFVILTILNFLLWGSQSTGAIPISLYIILLLLWFCVSVPLTFVGGYFGAKAPHIEYPVRTNQIPREVPPQKYPSWLLVLGAGTLPFGTLFIELFFIMSSIWMGRVYYVFGFLFIVMSLLVVVCAEVSVVLTYMHLCVEDYKWWWKSFFASGSVAIYIFLYSINYLVFDLKSLSGPVSATLYLGYSFLMVLAVMLATGTVGFLSSFWFVHYLFSSVKLD